MHRDYYRVDVNTREFLQQMLFLDYIEEASFAIDFKSHEGWMFKKLLTELVENKKLNYNYGKDNENNK